MTGKQTYRYYIELHHLDSTVCGPQFHSIIPIPSSNPSQARCPVATWTRIILIRTHSGKMSGCYLDTKSVGDEVEICGPFGLVEYRGRGVFKLPGEKTPRSFKHVAMMAGGTGLTPMLQVLQAALREEGDTTR